MPEEAREKILRTPDRLEQALQEMREIGLEVSLRGGTGGPLNTFLGTDELRSMGDYLIGHMRDEARWGESNKDFEPIDFAIAAEEVAHDHAAGKPIKTNVHLNERQPMKIAFNIFIDFWLPRLAQVAYGDQYATEVNSILQNTR